MKQIMHIFNKNSLIKQGSKLDLFLEKRYSSNQFTYKQIFEMLGPLIIDQFFIFFIGTLTASLISSSSEASMAAVSLVGPLGMIATAFLFALCSGGTIIVAQYKGKGDEAQVRRAAGQVILVAFLVATVSSLILIIFANPLINFFFSDIDQIVREKAANYLIGYCISLLPFSIFNGVFNVLRGVGDTKVCLRLTIIINVVCLIANILFINVLNLDILGTALALIIARVIGCVIALYIIFNRNSMISLSIKDLIHFDFSMQKSIVKLGAPFALEHIFFQLGFMLCQIYMAPLGKSVIAANSVASSISNLFYGVGFGVSNLTITVIGQCFGAGDIDTAKRYGKKMIRLGTITMIIAVAIIYPLSPLILKLFHPEATTLPLITQALFIGIIPIPFVWSLSYITPSILRAAGDANYTSIVSLVTMWIMRVGLGYILAIPCGFGLNGIWISMGAEWAVRGLLFWMRFKGTKWLNKKVV